MPTDRALVDLSWFRTHLLDEILPRWRKAACTASGLFLPHLDRAWRRTGDVTGTLVSQGRLLHNFSVGYRLTGETSYRDAVRAGVDFLDDEFREREVGGWNYRCDWNGKAIETFKDAYGHAFALLGFAHASWSTHEPQATYGMLGVATTLPRFRDEHGGIVPRLSRDWQTRTDAERPVNSQNPMMHMFEALLAMRCGMEDAPEQFTATIPHRLFVCSDRPLTQGLPEFYTEDWRPLPVEQGGRVDIGHQFEWAYLLSRAADLGYPEAYVGWANELLDYGMRVGYDPVEGGIFANADLNGEVIDRSKGWWQQCEAARTMMHFAVEHGRDDLWEPLAKTIAYFQANLIDPEFGGWYYSPTNRNKGSEWKVDYHVVGMCEEAIRLTEIVGDEA